MLSTLTTYAVTSRQIPPRPAVEPAIERRPFGFDPATYSRLERVVQVDLETLDLATGLPRTSASWVVAASGRVYIRSRRGARRLWYRELQAAPWLALWVDGERIPCLATAVTDPSRTAEVTAAYVRKYGYHPAVERVLHPAAVATTLQLHPLRVHD